MRKLLIGLAAVGFIAMLFLAYAHLMDTRPIESQNAETADDLPMPIADDAAPLNSDADVRLAQQARFVELKPDEHDPEIKRVARVFGFDKLLNSEMDASRRQVEKPYMIFYESDYHCRIDADTGMFQMETAGSRTTPKDAQLSGNVKIHVVPKAGSKISETVVEMEDLVFSSGRSEFATDRKVHIRSEQVELKGTGLIIIFDSVSGRIDYLRIRDLDQIRIQESKSPAPDAEITQVEKDTTSPPPSPAANDVDSAIPSGQTAADDGAGTESVRYYQCLLEDNVKIEYGNEIIVSAADQVKIKNISFDQGVGIGQSSEPSNAPKGPETTKQPEAEAKSDSEPKVSSEVIVTCDGGIILKPMEDEDASQTPTDQTDLSSSTMPMPLQTGRFISDMQQNPTVEWVNFAGQEDASESQETPDTIPEPAFDPNNTHPAKFEAHKIDYDLQDGSGFAHGPIRFTFYQPADPNSDAPKSWTPITVKADENARFAAGSSQTIKQVVFNGNVMTTRETETPDFVQSDMIHSEKLTVDLDEAGGLDRLSVTEGRVFVDSHRTKDDQELSRMKLYCTKISYNRVDDVILAEGPGKIEMIQHENTLTASADPNNPMSKPSVAVVDDFMAIRLDMKNLHIVADGDQDAMNLAYYPIVDGQIQKQVFVYSMQIQIDYLPDGAGVKKVFTDKSIIYEEWNSDKTKRLHQASGQTLEYNVSDEDRWVKIAGTPAVPCKLDGVPMEEIRVNPDTGEVDTSISSRPGFWKGR